MLPEFPREILNLILDEFPLRGDLKNLCEVSQAYYQAVLPKLYETVVLRRFPNTNSVTTEIATRHRSTHCFQFVKNFKSSLRYEPQPGRYDPRPGTRSSCIHKTSELYEGPYDWDPYIDPFPEFDIPILSLLNQFKDHQLESFRWGLETCLAPELFGTDGYLARKQNRIRSLSLVTDDKCLCFDKNPLDLTAFKNLRSFSWKRIGADDRAQGTLINWFKSNTKLIKTLELDFGITGDENDPYRIIMSDFPYDEALDNKRGNNDPDFPSLENLALSEVNFQRRPAEIARFFNISGLHTLKLRNCFEPDSLLQKVAGFNVPAKLTTFELVPRSYGSFPPSIEIITLFLESFSGLENLYLNLDFLIQKYPTCLRAIAKHRSTLKELVLVQPALDLFSKCDDAFFFTESGLLGALYDATEPLLNSILIDGVLECLGVFPSFIFLKPLLRPAMGKSLKVLHLRERELYHKGDELKGRKEELYEAMASNHQLFNPELETDNDSNNIQPDQLSRPKDINATLQKVRSDWRIRNESDRGIYREKWGIYKLLLLEFAQWAFGPNGFPNLQYIVYRHFFEDAYAGPSIVLRRDTKPFPFPPPPQQQPDLIGCESEGDGKHQPRFRLLESTDWELADLGRDYSEFLTSARKW